jgi:site-specific recombinase XerD
MPRYNFDVKDFLLFEEDVRKMYDMANNNEAVLISILWLTGARPGEIAILNVPDVTYTPDLLKIRLKTLKKGKGGDFAVTERTLEFERPKGMDVNIYIETIINHVAKLPNNEGSRVLPYTTRWAEKHITKLGTEALGKQLTPYHFRHSVMTWLAKKRWTLDQLKYFKGANSLRSIEPYIQAVPQVINMENLKRARKVAAQKDQEAKEKSEPTTEEETAQNDKHVKDILEKQKKEVEKYGN